MHTCFHAFKSLCLLRGQRFHSGDFWLGEEGLHHSLPLSDCYHTGKFPLWLLAAGCEHIWSQKGTVGNLPCAERSCRNLCLSEAFLQPVVGCFSLSCRAVLNCLLSHRAKTDPTTTTKSTNNPHECFWTFLLLISLLRVWGLARSHLRFAHTK